VCLLIDLKNERENFPGTFLFFFIPLDVVVVVVVVEMMVGKSTNPK
jgi:hypothetical protein